MYAHGIYLEYDVRDTVGNIEVGGGVRNCWRGVREKGGSDKPPLVTGLVPSCLA